LVGWHRRCGGGSLQESPSIRPGPHHQPYPHCICQRHVWNVADEYDINCLAVRCVLGQYSTGRVGQFSISTNKDKGSGNMQKPPLDMENLPLYKDLLVTVIKSRMTMDVASARADLLLDIFLINIDHLGTEESFVKRTVNHLEMDLLDARDAPEQLGDATADTARAIWAYRKNPTTNTDQSVREAFERWEAVYRQTIGELPAETYMDIENARCLTDAEYYSKPPLPFVSRARGKVGNQN
jgi:hypothetical protein